MIKSENLTILSGGVRLSGVFFSPEAQERVPGVCICHGIPRVNKPVEEKGYPALAKRFCEAGCAALIFNFQGTSGSEGEFGFSAWSRNVSDAVTQLASSPLVDPERLGLLSFSAGAFVSWSVVARDQRIRAFASCSSPSDLSKIPLINEGIKYAKELGVLRIKDIERAERELRSDFQKLSPLKWVGKISPRPVLIVHGDRDDVIPVECAYELYERAKEPKKLLIFKGVNHQIRNSQEAMDAVVEWMVENI